MEKHKEGFHEVDLKLAGSDSFGESNFLKLNMMFENDDCSSQPGFDPESEQSFLTEPYYCI